MEVRQFKGGSPTRPISSITPNRKYVLRRKPPGKLLPSAHAVDREFRVISALHPTGFPVAKPYLLCEDESVIGTMFYVMECVEGRIYLGPAPARLVAAGAHRDLRGDERDAGDAAQFRSGKDRPGRFRQTRAIISHARFRAGPSSISSPKPRRSRRWTSSSTGCPRIFRGQDRNSVVHGDYRLDNMILHPTRTESAGSARLGTLHHRRSDGRFHLSPDAMADAAGRHLRRNRRRWWAPI